MPAARERGAKGRVPVAVLQLPEVSVFLTIALLALSSDSTFKLEPCEIPFVAQAAKCGTYWVWEDRARKAGRRIPLEVIILPSRSATPARDPFWVVSPGGPGSTNSIAAAGLAQRWWRDDRDVVLVDLRGTSGPNVLDCAYAGVAQRPAEYLSRLFPPAGVRACRDSLSKVADLSLYTSMLIVDDLDEVRQALGYQKINLWGASWGTRAVLIWLRRHPQAVRSAIIEGVAPTAMKNPLSHARAAQDAFDLIARECSGQPSCHAAFPDPAGDLKTVVDRLHREAARIPVPNGLGGVDTVPFTWQQFAEALRVMEYYIPTERRVPLLLHQAAQGDLAGFAEAAINSNRSLRTGLREGFLLSITCSEDVPRILESEIGPATAGTYVGDSRVREQMAACAQWPHQPLDPAYGDPVRSSVPVFLLSGTLDPVSPPRFAEETVKYLPNGIHVLAPGAHVPNGFCVIQMERAFLKAASGKAVDTSCVATMTLPPFATN